MITVTNIAKSYGHKKILTDISFTVNPGESAAIIGRNGCGKSTLMQILSGILKPDSGSLRYYGTNPLKERSAFRKMCGYLPQSNPLMEELTVLDNLKLFGAKKNSLRDPLLEPFELEPILKTPVRKLSGGMKRRVAIACAVHHIPSVLFMDEPTTALDIYFKSSIHNWMQQYQSVGGILILATHDELEFRNCNRCFYMNNGSLNEIDPKRQSSEQIRQMIIQNHKL